MGQQSSKFPVWPSPEEELQLTDFGELLLKKCLTIEAPKKNSSVYDFLKKSAEFPLEFGTNTCRVKSQPPERYFHIEQQIGSAYPVLHERCISLYLSYLEHKCCYGNDIEKQIYMNLSLTSFVQRLLEKRCATFLGPSDIFKLVTGEHGNGGFEKVGSESEVAPLILAIVLSYSEIKLSALLSVSSHSEFINDGRRHNRGIIEENKEGLEREGVIIGLIGARLHKRYLMEYEDIIINKDQNTLENGYVDSSYNNNRTSQMDYRRIWQTFYDEKDHLYGSVSKNQKRFGDSWDKHDIFDYLIMKKRYAISIDTLLLESESRARAAEKLAYIHVVGIGLGCWKVTDEQEKIFLECFEERLKILLPNLLHVGAINFSWFNLNGWKNLKNGSTIKCESHPNGGIETYFSRRNPASKLPTEHENMLLIVSYAWDGNALPGNDFWLGYLSSSGDPAAACSTLISELHNPHINSDMVNGTNLHVASPKYGILHIRDYAQKYFQNKYGTLEPVENPKEGNLIK